MIALPAVDLREGACVQLVGGDYANERVRRDDPVAAARDWERRGFAALHVVDLDAATGRGDNASVVGDIIRAVQLPVQVGGGVRDDAAIDRLLSLGAARVVVGTRALLEPAWFERAAARVPGRLVAAMDVRGDRVLTHGWTRELPEPIDAVLVRLRALPLAGVLVTAVHREGLLAGPDIALTAGCAAAAGHPLFASGGIATLADLDALAAAGAAGAVIGMALYTGALDADAAAARFGAAPTP